MRSVRPLSTSFSRPIARQACPGVRRGGVRVRAEGEEAISHTTSDCGKGQKRVGGGLIVFLHEERWCLADSIYELLPAALSACLPQSVWLNLMLFAGRSFPFLAGGSSAHVTSRVPLCLLPKKQKSFSHPSLKLFFRVKQKFPVIFCIPSVPSLE